MAIYVYVTTSGVLYSHIPENKTIAQAQADGHLASDAHLAANGLTAVDGLPPLGPTVVWDETNKTTKTVTAPVPAAPMPTFFFIARFTATEWAGLRAAYSTDSNVMQFLDAMNATNVVDMQEPIIKNFGTYCVNKAYLTAARANTILTTPYVKSSETS
jgi:hypothetical protein